MTTYSTNHLIFYAHGQPGSSAEIDHFLVGAPDKPIVLPFNGVELFDKKMREAQAATATIIGFSLGAMSAIELASQRPELVSKLQLISPAAPLELGDFLPSMAGKPIFTAAIKSKLLFAALTAVQGIIVRLAPKYLIKSMFANSPKAEQALLDAPDFIAMLKHGLRHSLCGDTKSYRAAVMGYVQPWEHRLPNVKCPIEIWHGSADDWAPLAMSEALVRVFGDKAKFNICDGLGHYSTLQETLKNIVIK